MPGLRVALDVTPLLGIRAGVAQCVQQLLDALPASAPDVEVVPYVLSRRARQHASTLPAGTRFLPLPAGLAIRAWGVIDWPRADAQLGPVDVVHGTNFVVPPTSAAATVTVHDTWCLRHPTECAPAVRPFDRAVRRAIRRGAIVHATNEATAREIRERYGQADVEVVPLGVPDVADAGALPRQVTPPFVLSLSTQEPRKRQAALVRAFGDVAARRPDICLVIAGAPAGATDDIRAAVAALPASIGARVVMLGAVDDAARSTLLRRATVLAYPSADEGFGIPVAEAMAAGVPAVATRVGGIPEVAGDAALLVDVGDDAGLADALSRIIDDAALRTTLTARGADRVADLTWTRHASGMAALWRRAAERGR